jgi:hypothetical protein
MIHYISDHDAITAVIGRYVEGLRTGNSAFAKPAFHEACTFFGYFNGQLLAGPVQMLFDWVDGNGPVPGVETRIASIDVHETIAVVRVEVEKLAGKFGGQPGGTLSDLFQLIKTDGRWLISQKSFHWHAA